MRLFDLTLPTPQENLALDEALLEEAETAEEPSETLRIWEPLEPFVVLGRNSQAAREVHLQHCRARGVAVLRRASGGAAVVVAPGSLMYALVLSYDLRPALRSLDEAHRFVLGTTLGALRPLAPAARQRGTSDLAVGACKFSGNSLRCKRRYFLYHGTLLYACDLDLLEHCLAMPPREPDYRQHRPHSAFVANLSVSAGALRRALIGAWQATPAANDWPRQAVQQLVATRYARPEWNLLR
jgi:lipoate-protein ligase A